MAKVLFMAANQDMAIQAAELSDDFDLELEVKLIASANVVEEAQKAARNGVNIVIARGYHAYLVSKYTNLPVVRIVMTGQEIALLVAEAREIAAKRTPLIGLVGFKGMFSSTEPFEKLFDVVIKKYYVDHPEELEAAVDQAGEDGANVIIGGETALHYAAQKGLPALFQKSRVDSLAEALRSAKKVAYAIDLEKQNTAELRTILDYSFDGVIKLDRQGRIIVVNFMAEKILGKSSAELLGKSILDILDIADFQQVLDYGKNLYSVIINKSNLALIANIVNMTVDNVSQGIFLSFQEFKKIEELEAAIRKRICAKGYVARHTFEQLVSCSAQLKRLKTTGAIYARYDLPVLISGELGTGKRFVAESMHNSSLRRDNQFLAVDCQGCAPDLLQKQLFGYELENPYTNQSGKVVKGLFELAHSGTVFLERIAKLDEYSQNHLLQILQKGTVTRLESGKTIPVNVRIICGTDVNLVALVQQGCFNEELYYRLSLLELYLPPLRERREDIAGLLDYYFDKYNNIYKKYLVLTDDAKELINRYAWRGNVAQLKFFCEKITVLAEKKVLDAEFVNRYLVTFPDISVARDGSKGDGEASAKRVILYRNPESATILAALEKHCGNRALAAAELGISATTLWRKMKKYHIGYKFEI
jgi:transcriptional regulator with PAS, ATPase and Fis domain